MALGSLKATVATGSGIFVLNFYFFHVNFEMTISFIVSM
jgi:hypothetical protein